MDFLLGQDGQMVKVMPNCFKIGAETISDMLITNISLTFKNMLTNVTQCGLKNVGAI